MNPDPEKHMGLIDHLEELRHVIIRVLLGVLVCSVCSLYFSESILQLLMKQAGDIRGQFVVLSPTEGFMVQIKLSILSGIVLSVPWTLYAIWSFLAPGLLDHERRYFAQSIPVLVLLFLTGVLLAWYMALPMGIRFLLGFQIADVTPQLSIEKYVSFCSSMFLIFGGAFELPVFIVVLNKVGILSLERLYTLRRYNVVCMFILAAILTPPDVVTQTMLAIPLILLFELTVYWIAFTHRRDSVKDT